MPDNFTEPITAHILSLKDAIEPSSLPDTVREKSFLEG